MITYQLANPFLLSTRIDLDESTRQSMVDSILDQMTNQPNYHGGYTFEIKDQDCNFSKLYNKFYEISSQIFGPWTPSVRHKHWCWANVYNKDGYFDREYASNLHNHQGTSMINGVFYLDVPKGNTEESGALKIFYENQYFYYLPDTLDLVIMPNWLYHEPLATSSQEYRIAINMEINFTEDINDIYSLEKILKYCSPSA
jgi:hypothetical protein